MTEEAYAPKDTENSVSSRNAIPGWFIPALFVIAVPLCFAGEFLMGQVAEPGPEGKHIFYPAPHGQLGDPPEYIIEKRNLMSVNNAIGFGIIGAVLMTILGYLIGTAGGQGQGIKGGILGLVLGTILCAIGGGAGYYLSNYFQQATMDNMLKTYMVWMPVMLGFGLVPTLIAAMTGLSKSMPNAIVTGFFGAALACSVYVLTATFFFIGFANLTYAFDAGVRHVAYVSLGLAPALACTLLVFMDKPKSAAAKDEVEAA